MLSPKSSLHKTNRFVPLVLTPDRPPSSLVNPVSASDCGLFIFLVQGFTGQSFGHGIGAAPGFDEMFMSQRSLRAPALAKVRCFESETQGPRGQSRGALPIILNWWVRRWAAERF